MDVSILGVGAVALLDDEPDERLRQFERIFSPEEFAEWRTDFDGGRWLFVRLRLFADLADGQGIARHDDGEIDGVQFARPHGNDNLEHAREAVPMALDQLVAALGEEGIDTTPQRLLDLPVTVELDPALREALRR